MNKYETQTPYCASYLIFRKGDEVAFVLRENTSWMNGYYGLPSGKVENDENFADCALREAKEETGVSLNKEQIVYTHTSHRKGENPWVDVYFEVVDCKQQPVNNEPDVHSELAWLDINNLPENVIPSVRDTLESIANGELFSAHGW